MPNPIYVGSNQNPYGQQAANFLTQLALSKMAHKMRMEEMEAQAKMTQANKAREANFQAALAGSDIYRSDAEKPPEGYIQNPWDTTSYVSRPKDELVSLPNGVMAVYRGGKIIDLHNAPKSDAGTVNDYNIFYQGFVQSHPELSGPELNKAASEAWQTRMIERYQAQRDVFATTPTPTPGVFFDKAKKSYYEIGNDGKRIELSSEEVKRKALIYKEEIPTNDLRVMQQSVPSVKHLIYEIRDALKASEGGPIQGRWKELWSGKVGTADPKFRRLSTGVALLQTRLMKMHVGARGGQYIMEHFEKMINASKDDPRNLVETLDAIERYADEVGQTTFGNETTTPSRKQEWINAAKVANKGKNYTDEELSRKYDELYGGK